MRPTSFEYLIFTQRRSIGDWYHELDEELQETVLDPIINQAENRPVNDRSLEEDENEAPPLPNINFDPSLIPSQSTKSGGTLKRVTTRPKPIFNIDPSLLKIVQSGGTTGADSTSRQGDGSTQSKNLDLLQTTKIRAAPNEQHHSGDTTTTNLPP